MNRISKGIVGLSLGAVLVGTGYGTFELADRQLRAQEHANSIEQRHAEWVEYMKRIGQYPESSEPLTPSVQGYAEPENNDRPYAEPSSEEFETPPPVDEPAPEPEPMPVENPKPFHFNAQTQGDPSKATVTNVNPR